MSQTQTVVVGPLAAGSATKIGLSQKAAAAQALVLNGAACDFTANNICTSQTPSGAGALTLNGTIVVSGVALIYPNYASINRRVYITSASNDSSRTFTVTGTVWTPKGYFGATETVTGANASVVSTTASFATVTSITISGSAAGAVTVGVNGYATLDKARRVLFTPAGDDSGITYVITGTDVNGTAISETLAGVANPSTCYTTLDYLTITSITISGAAASTMTIGTNGIASSPWVRFDGLAANAQVAYQSTVSGTVNFTIQSSMEDPTLPIGTGNPLTYRWTPATVTWVDDTTNASKTATLTGTYAAAPVWSRTTLNSGTGTVTTTYQQATTR